MCIRDRAGGGLEITQVVGSQPRRQQQPPALERKQVFFGAKVLRTAQKLQLKDDVLVFHALPLCLPQGVKGAGRKNKDIPLIGRAGRSAHLPVSYTHLGCFAISEAYDKYPLAVKLHIADLKATYLMEHRTSAVR